MLNSVDSMKKSLKNFNYGLYLALLTRLFMPTIYQTFRVSILGSLPDTTQLTIASQMTWVNVLLKIIEESILLPLYFCLGDSIENVKITKNKIKTGLITSGFVYSCFSVLVSIFAWYLIELMDQNQNLRTETLKYIRVEVIGILAGSLSKFLMVVFVMLQWNSMLYLTLFIQMIRHLHLCVNSQLLGSFFKTIMI